jgi:hypothetical protein
VTEDSGTFKTNPRNPGDIRHFVIRILPGNSRIRGGFERHSHCFWPMIVCRFSATTDGGGLLYSGFSLIRGGEGG